MIPSEDDTRADLRRSDFGADFRWGCATSAYQIEGAVEADGRGESIWDRFCTLPGRVRDGASGAVACDHYHRWREDLDLARDLGVNVYRFSIAWPRVCPDGRGARVNPKALEFYSRLVDGLLERGIEPWVTLYHWDLPQALQEAGGWNRRDTSAHFADYADVVSRALGDRVRRWITHNEPWSSAFHGHWDGQHAPGMRNWRIALQACHHILLSHGLASSALRANQPAAQIGISLGLHPLRPASSSAEDLAALQRHDGLRNRWFLDPLYGRGYPTDILVLCGADKPRIEPGDLEKIATPTDFVGVNYYFPETVVDAPGAPPLRARVVQSPQVERTALGWEVSPGGMVELLRRLHDDYQAGPIFVTENGSCYDDAPAADGSIPDSARRRYLALHIAALHQAIASGVDVRGYFAWSLLDNFEWAEGYARRFGLAYVDFKTLERRWKSSGHWYREFLAR